MIVHAYHIVTTLPVVAIGLQSTTPGEHSSSGEGRVGQQRANPY